MHVEHEQPFYQLSNLPTYKLRCELFEYNDENLDTGIEAIDDIEKDYAYTYLLTLDSASYGYTVGEIITQTFSSGVVMQGEVAAFSDSDNIMKLIHIGADDGNYHEFITGSKVLSTRNLGNSILPRYSNSLVLSVNEDNKIAENEQNDDFETTADGFLDFSETNPFGDPNET
jgi:hypothetical protein